MDWGVTALLSPAPPPPPSCICPPPAAVAQRPATALVAKETQLCPRCVPQQGHEYLTATTPAAPQGAPPAITHIVEVGLELVSAENGQTVAQGVGFAQDLVVEGHLACRDDANLGDGPGALPEPLLGDGPSLGTPLGQTCSRRAGKAQGQPCPPSLGNGESPVPDSPASEARTYSRISLTRLCSILMALCWAMRCSATVEGSRTHVPPVPCPYSHPPWAAPAPPGSPRAVSSCPCAPVPMFPTSPAPHFPAPPLGPGTHPHPTLPSVLPIRVLPIPSHVPNLWSSPRCQSLSFGQHGRPRSALPPQWPGCRSALQRASWPGEGGYTKGVMGGHDSPTAPSPQPPPGPSLHPQNPYASTTHSRAIPLSDTPGPLSSPNLSSDPPHGSAGAPQTPSGVPQLE